MDAFQIVVCDDDKEICNQLEEIINEYGLEHYYRFQVLIYHSGQKLYEDLVSNVNKTPDLIFLDIEYQNDKLSGVDLGNAIREELKNDSVQIVYISGKEEYCMSLFDVRPLHFRLKPFDPEAIKKDIHKALELKGISEEVFRYQKGYTVNIIKLNDILYFESKGHKVRIIAKDNKSDTFYGKLSDIYEELKDYRFLMTHNSYLVNYKYVKMFTPQQFIMVNDEEIPVSRGKRSEILKLQIQFEKGWESE